MIDFGEMRGCEKCLLSCFRKRVVVPLRPENESRVRVMVVGEGPGEWDEKLGVPFSGKSGQELWGAWRKYVGGSFKDLWVTNVVKCRGPEGRGASKEEMGACRGWLEQEIEEFQPQVIVTFGEEAAKEVLGYGVRMGEVHGTVRRGRGGEFVVPCYHPAAGLHAPGLLGYFYGDLKVVGGVIRELDGGEGDLGGYSNKWARWGDGDYRVLDTYAEAKKWTDDSLRGVDLNNVEIGVDTEGSGDDEIEEGGVFGGKPWSVQISFGRGRAAMVLVGSEAVEAVEAALWACKRVVMHNAMHDLAVLEKMGIDLTSRLGEIVEEDGLPALVDTMVAVDVLQDEPRGLKAIGVRHAYLEMKEYKSVIREVQTKHVVEWLGELMASGRWRDKRVQVKVDADTGEEKLGRPESLFDRAWGILSDWMADEGGVDVVDRWKGVWKDLDEEEKGEVEEGVGKMPVVGLGDVWEEGSRQDVITYACRDAEATIVGWEKLRERLREAKLLDVFGLDMQAMKMVRGMERNGLPVDLGRLGEMREYLLKKAAEALEKIEGDAGRKVNPGSPKQAAWYIYDHLGCKSVAGKPKRSTLDGVMSVQVLQDERVEWVQDWRGFEKKIGSYIDPIARKVRASKDGRLRATLRVTGTETGRMTARDPNVLSIPSRGEEGKMMKRCFVAPKGWSIVNADYSQVELRIFAHVTQEPELVQDYLRGADVHARTASKSFRVALEEVTGDQRDKAKTINFGAIYGIMAMALALQLKCSVQEAQEFLTGYFAGYTMVNPWKERTIREIKGKGFVEDMFGRRRWMGGIWSDDRRVRADYERQGCNFKVQSPASGIIKRAMVEVEQEVLKDKRVGHGRGAFSLLQVHDALVFQVKDDYVEWFAVELKRRMEGVVRLSVPVVADVSFGQNWAEQVKI